MIKSFPILYLQATSNNIQVQFPLGFKVRAFPKYRSLDIESSRLIANFETNTLSCAVSYIPVKAHLYTFKDWKQMFG